MAAEAGPGGSEIPQPQLEDGEIFVGDKHNETSKQWYDAYSGSWVRKEIPVVRPNGKEKVVHNPAPWTPKEVLTRKTGLWKDNLEKREKHAQDWGSLDKKFPVHEWLMGDMLDAELERAERRKVEEARRDAHNAGAPELTADAEKQAQKQAKKEFLAEKVEFYKTEGEERLSQDLQRYLEAEGCGRQKGGFRKGEQYGRKGAPLRADLEEQARRWAEFFRKNGTSASTGAGLLAGAGQQDGGRKGKGKGKNAEEQQRARDEAIRRQQEEEQEPVATAAIAGKNGGGKGESSRATTSTSTRARHLANAPELPPRPDRKDEAALANNDSRVLQLEDRSLAELALLYHSEVKPCDVVQQWKDLEERGSDANKSREIGRLVKQIEARKSREQPDLKAAYQRRYLEKWMKENRDVKTTLAKHREELRNLERSARDSHDVERKTVLQNFFERIAREQQIIDLKYDFAGHHVREVEPSNKDDTTSVELEVLEPEDADRVKHNQFIAAICAYHDWDFGFAQNRIPYRSDPEHKVRPAEGNHFLFLHSESESLRQLENTLDELHLGKRSAEEMERASHWLVGMDWLTHEFGYTERRKNCPFRYFNLQERAASRSVLWSVMKAMWQWGIPLPLREHCANSKFRFYVDLQVPTAATYNRKMVFESDFLRKDHPFLHALAKVVHDLYDPTEDGEIHNHTTSVYQETKEQHWKSPVACIVLRGSGFDRWNKDRHVMRLRFLFPSIVCDKTTAMKTRNYIVNLLTHWAADEAEDLARLQRGEHPRNHARSPVQEDRLERHLKRGTTLVTDMEEAIRGAGKRDDKNSLCKCIVPDLWSAENARYNGGGGYPETGSFVEMVWGESTSQAGHQRHNCLRGLSWGLEEEKNGVAMLLLRESDRDGNRKNMTHIEFKDFEFARTQFDVDNRNPHKWYRNALSLSNGVLPDTLDDLFKNYRGPTREDEATNEFQEWCKTPAEEQQALLRRNTRLKTGGGS